MCPRAVGRIPKPRSKRIVFGCWGKVIGVFVRRHMVPMMDAEIRYMGVTCDNRGILLLVSRPKLR